MSVQKILSFSNFPFKKKYQDVQNKERKKKTRVKKDGEEKERDSRKS